MKKIKKVLCMMMCITMVACSMSACGNTSAEQATAASGETQADQQEAATEDSGDEKAATIKVGVSGTPNLDPAIANTSSDLITEVNVYDSLVFPDAESESGVVGRVAESWEVSDDAMTYTFHLKSGIKFHNGDELTAEDVVYSMDRFLTIGEGFSYIFDGHVAVGSTEATDDQTVVFHLSDAYGPFLNALVRLAIVNADEVKANYNTSDSTYGENCDYGKDYLLTADAGSGAYKAVTLVQQDYFYAEKFDDWFMGWDNQYAPEGFKLMAITESATVRTMMNNKELDITDQWQSTETLNALAQVDGIDIATYSNNLEYNMYYNNSVAPMDDVNYRRAISCLVDYDTICEQILLGSVPSAGPVPRGMAGHVDTNQFTYDVEKAKEYLAASAYADTYQDYTLEVVVNSDVADLEKIALLLKSSCEQVGINVEISKAPWVSLVDKLGSSETSPMITMINYGSAVDDAGVCMQSRYSKATQGTWNNGEWLEDEWFENTLNEALSTADSNERLAKYADLQNYLVDDLCASCFMCDLAERCAYQSAYVTWPFVESASEGSIASTVNGYTQIYSTMEYHTENK